MPNFYNTAAPTPTSKNTINDIAVTFGIRDFLLNKNLQPVYPSALSVSPGNQKIGEPVLDTMVGTGNVVSPNGLPLETEGLLRYDIAVLPNRYRDSSSTFRELQKIEDITQTTYKDFSDSKPFTGEYPTSIETDGLMVKNNHGKYRYKNTLKNLYVDTTKQVDVSDYITLNPLDISQQITGYLDTYGGLNLGGSDVIQASSIIGSVLNGQGLGLAKGGVVTNFDLRSSLAGRVLGATGLINDTKLGMIGGQQLALSLANNAAFNLEQDLLGKLNVQDNILSLVKNGSLAGFRPNYKITVPGTTLGKVGDYASRILGFTLPKSYLDDAGSIFQSENGDIGNIDRANKMLLNTGKGQLTALITNIVSNINGTGTGSDSPEKTYFRSGYAPAYEDHKGISQINGNQIYAFSKEGKIDGLLKSTGGAIPDLSYDRIRKVEESGFNDFSSSGFRGDSYTSSNIKNTTFTWTSDPNSKTTNVSGNYQPVIGDKKSLINKTQILFNSGGMLNIVSVKGASSVNPSQIQTAVYNNMISKGSGVLSKDNFDGNGKLKGNPDGTPDNTFCRSWTTFNRYENLQNLIRNGGLSKLTPYRNQIEGSILDDNGFPKIAPYITDKASDPKKFMFSIENLAWSDNVNDLLQGEQGPGDLVTGKRGRIMWFPPYDIQFTENNSVNWESTNFIGRGESVYSYNNTERSGTLSFKIVVDHSTYTNTFRGTNGPDDQYVDSFMAGCVDVNSEFSKKLTVSEISALSTDLLSKAQKKVLEEEKPPTESEIDVFFPNDVSTYVPTYENGKTKNGQLPIDYINNPEGFKEGIGSMMGTTSKETWIDDYNFGFNAGHGTYGKIITVDNNPYNGFSDPNLIPALNSWLNNHCPNCVVTVTGYASAQGTDTLNDKLAIARAQTIIDYLKPLLHTNITNKGEKDLRFIPSKNSKPISVTGCDTKAGARTDNEACKSARKAGIVFSVNSNLAAKNVASPSPVVKKPLKRLNTKITNRFYNESNYFEKLTLADSFVFDKFREKIRYFHPAFHSTTPEGLNSRLTFLNQCTRQGPTLEEQGATNLAFGRAPVCILRIGDFYNTKIVIDSLGIDYEPLVWDLNPEGSGVQPMIANVNISFKFIGGSTLMGPINKLQNALSFNYYANTQVYDVRADYIAKDTDPNIQTGSKGEALSDYNILNDFNPATYKSDVKNTVTIIPEEPEIDQTKDAENVDGSSNPQTEIPKSDDNTVISNIGLTGFYKPKENEDFRLILNYITLKDTPFLLSDGKTYTGSIFVTNYNNPSFIFNIGNIKIRSNGNIGVISESYNTSGYGPISKDINGQWVQDVSIYDEEDYNTIIKLLKETGNVLSIKWNNTNNSKSNINFSELSATK